ncbi:MAG: selenide, water dikinase SelD, partial [Thermoleophilia bacterium]
GVVLRGGMEKVLEAGAELAGGHSIDDKEPKYGLAVTGVARPEEIVYNGGAEPGDRLVLTKRLGIGVLASALKNGLLTEDDMLPAIEEAAELNAAAAAAMAEVGVHACTDVSGFGLAGHLSEMLDASAAAAVVRLHDVPLHDGVLDLIGRSVYAGGLRNNRDFLVPRLGAAGGGPAAAAGGGAGAPAGPFAGPIAGQDPRVLALFDPQTSGGLLMAVAPASHARLLAALGERGVSSWTVGEVTAAPAGTITVEG